MTDDLVAFLDARLAEDEATARAAGGKYESGLRWYEPDRDSHPGLVGDGNGQVVTYDTDTIREHGTHIARHDPARVLRQVDAMRRVVVVYENAERALRSAEPDTPPHDLMTGATNTMRRTLRHLATIWQGHEEYRQEWAP